MKFLVIEFSTEFGSGGLGDRLVGLTSAILLAKSSKRELIIKWNDPPMDHVWTIKTPYNQAIHGSRSTSQILDCHGTRTTPREYLSTRSLDVMWTASTVWMWCNQEIGSFLYENPYYPHLRGKFYDDLYQAYRSIFTDYIQLKVNPTIQSSKRIVALQLRCGDVYMGCGDFVGFELTKLKSHILPLCYQLVQQRFPPDQYALFFTSDIDCTDMMRQIFGDYELLYHDGIITHFDRQGNHDGVVKTVMDLQVMCNVDVLIFSWHSNFGRVAGLTSPSTTQLFALTSQGQCASVSRTKLHSKHLNLDNLDELLFYPVILADETFPLQLNPDFGFRFRDCRLETTGELKTIKDWINDTDVIVDVGAGPGTWTSRVSSLHPLFGGSIHALEPNRETYLEMVKVLRDDPFVQFYALGTSDSSGGSSLYIPHIFNSHMMASCFNRTVFENNVRTVPIFLMTIDSWMETFDIPRIDFLHLDTEGSEVSTLHGARNAIKNHLIQKIQFKYSGTYKDANTTLKEAFTMLTHAGYTMYRVTSRGLLLLPKWVDEFENYEYSNYFAMLNVSVEVEVEVKSSSNECQAMVQKNIDAPFMSHIDAIIFINLDIRTDRYSHIMKQLARIPNLNWSKVYKIQGVPGGLTGCHQSHMGVVKLAMDNKWKNVLILEDDFTWEEDIQTCFKRLDSFLHERGSIYGIAQLSHNLKKSVEIPGSGLHLVQSSSDASGYLLNERVYSDLLSVYMESLPKLAATGAHWLFLNDVVWDQIRNIFPCFAFVPPLGYQCEGFSNLSNQMEVSKQQK